MATPLGITNPLQLSNTVAPTSASPLHDIGQLAGHALNALPGYSTLGSQITNPNVNYLGKVNPPTPSNNYYTPTTSANSSNPAGTTPQATTTTPGTVLGASTSADPAYGLYAGQAQTALQRALDAFNTQQGAIGNSFNQQQNELTSGLNKNQSDYNQGLTTQDQNRLTNDNQIHQNANQSYQSLLRILGGMGAGGGSEAQYLVPQLIGQNMNQQLGGADQTAAQNKQALTTTFNNYLGDEKNQQKQLNDWQTGQLLNAQATYNQNKSNLSNILAALNSHADTAANLGSQLMSQEANIPNVTNFTPTYTGVTPTYTAPQLSTFETQASPTAQIKANTPGATTTTPYLNLLLGNDQKKLQTA